MIYETITTLRAENAKLREEVEILGLDLAHERQRSMHNDDRIERLLSYIRSLRDRTPSRKAGALTPEIAAEQMKHISESVDDYGNNDQEEQHTMADELMLRILRQHGYGDAADIFDKMDKWYS